MANVPPDIQTDISIRTITSNSNKTNTVERAATTQPKTNATRSTATATTTTAKEATAPVATAKHKFNSIVIFLYFSYTLNIYILWTNCVIFAVAVQTIDSNRSKLHDFLLQSSLVYASHNERNSEPRNDINYHGSNDAIQQQTKQKHHHHYPTKSLDNLFNIIPKHKNKLSTSKITPKFQSLFSIRTNVSNGTTNDDPGHHRRRRRKRQQQQPQQPVPTPCHKSHAQRNKLYGTGCNGKNVIKQQQQNQLSAKKKSRKPFTYETNKNFQRQLRHKRESTKNVIRNAIYRIIKRNVNNFTRNLLSNNNTMNNMTSSLSSSSLWPSIDKPKISQSKQLKSIELQSSSREERLTTSITSTVPILTTQSILLQSPLSTWTSSSSYNFINHRTAATVAATGNYPELSKMGLTTIAPSRNNNPNNIETTTSAPINTIDPTDETMTYSKATTTMAVEQPTTEQFNSVVTPMPPTTNTALSSSRRPFIVHQSNHYKVNNVFEMAFKLKHNKTDGNGRKKTTNIAAKPIGGKGIVSLLGLFELSTRNGLRPEGHSELAAAQMAVRHINQRGLLPGYTLQLLTNDTMVSPTILCIIE